MRTIDTTLISIHALRKESDQREWFDKLDGVISIHALRKESDDSQRGFAGISEAFQSTLSVRRATATSIALGEPLAFQSTLSVRRATSCPTVFSASCQISIHALRKESDHDLHAMPKLLIGFQSTLSVRRATEYCFNSPHSSIFQSTLSVRRATFTHVGWRGHI